MEIHERPATPQQGQAPQIHLDGEARWRPRRPERTRKALRGGRSEGKRSPLKEGNKKHQKQGENWNPTPPKLVSPNGMKPFWGGLLGAPFLVNEVHARWIRARYYFVLVLFHVHTCNPVFKKKSRESNETWKDIIFF